MKTTIFGIVLEVVPEQNTVRRRLMHKYGFMFRWAFQRLLTETLPVADWERQAAAEIGLPLRHAKDAAP